MLARHAPGLAAKLPEAVLARLEQRGDDGGGSGHHQEQETPGADAPCFAGDPPRHHAVLVGSNRRAVAAAADRARALGYADPLVLTTTLEGEAREVAKVLAAARRSPARNT